jgi:signal peptidase II
MKRKYWIALGVGLTGVVIDQIAKTIIDATMTPIERISVIPGFLDLLYARNKGMAFGMLQDLPDAYRTPFFSFITLVAVLIIVHLLRQAPDRVTRFPIALGLILSGAFGNLTDRFRWEHVVDFIQLTYWPPNRHWPIFNLADTFITIGIGLLILDTLLARDEDPAPEPGPSGAAPRPGPDPGQERADSA